MNNNIAIVIPARYASTRLPHKCLLKLGDKTIIQHVYERAISANIGRVIVACDDIKIKENIEAIGGIALLTSKDCKSGTDRVAEAVHNIKENIIVNLQGDEPFIEPEVIRRAVECIKGNKIATVAYKEKVKRSDDNPNRVKVVLDNNGYAIYFSRSLIPYPRDNDFVEAFYHIGIYVYKKEFLLEFTKWGPGKLESIEKLEQLRALEHGVKIKVDIVDYKPLGIDTHKDYEIALKRFNNDK